MGSEHRRGRRPRRPAEKGICGFADRAVGDAGPYGEKKMPEAFASGIFFIVLLFPLQWGSWIGRCNCRSSSLPR